MKTVRRGLHSYRKVWSGQDDTKKKQKSTKEKQNNRGVVQIHQVSDTYISTFGRKEGRGGLTTVPHIMSGMGFYDFGRNKYELLMSEFDIMNVV